MTLKKVVSEAGNPKLEKYVSRLTESAKRAKKSLQDALEKSVIHFQNKAEKSTSKKEKSLFLKKSEKISNDLDMLKILLEDEIIRYALSTSKKIMPIASNPRMPREVRMKARVAAHKPLSTHLARIKQKLSESRDSESESESENEPDNGSSALNKITFNNTIVSMRKDVRRAKVHIIHKLTRNIKKLRAAKGKEDKVAKNQRKADRLYNKVIHIKELLEDEVSKFALSTTQNTQKLANDIKAPTTSQALAIVAVNPFVANHVKNFRQKYPDWQKAVGNLLKKKNKKRKLNLETKAKEKKSDELSPAKSESDSENAEENGSENNEESESENNEDSGSENNEESELENNGESGLVSGEKSSENENEDDTDSQDNVTSQDTTDEEDASDSNGVKSTSNITNERSKKIKVSKEVSNVKNKLITGKKINKDKKKLNGASLSSLHVEARPVEVKPKVIDPFFVTSTNEEYVTSQVPISGEDDLLSNKLDHFESNKSGMFNKFDNKKQWKRTSSEWKHGKFNRFQESAPYKNTSSFEKNSGGTRMDKLVFRNRKERRKVLQQPKFEEKVEKLHPSWEAKKKQSVIIPFQGKKVTFD